MTLESELKPCPFCGGKIATHAGHADIQYFGCDPATGGCGAVVSFAPRKIGGAAFDAWNKRADDPPESKCWHRWVDARNGHVESGEICLLCNAIRAGNQS